MRRLRTGFGLVLWLLAADVATVGAYEIIVGQGVELCEACLQNLLRQSAEEAVCDRQYASELGLSKVEWAPLNLGNHTGLLMRMDNLINSGNESAKGIFENDHRKAKEYAEGGPVRKLLPTIVLEKAEVDIDHDGIPDRLLRYEQGKCRNMFGGWQYFYEAALVLFKDDWRSIDYVKTDLLIQYPFLEELKSKYRDKWRTNIFGLQLYQVFTYKGSIYFDRWDGGSGPDTNTLSIYQVDRDRARRLCQFRLFPPDVRPHH
jgi:hypothetical protein